MGKKRAELHEGHIVRFTRNFLRSTGQTAGAPINGKVVGFGWKNWPRVHWSDRDDEADAVLVNPCNLEFDPRAADENDRVTLAQLHKDIERGTAREPNARIPVAETSRE